MVNGLKRRWQLAKVRPTGVEVLTRSPVIAERVGAFTSPIHSRGRPEPGQFRDQRASEVKR